jgi:predicted nucleic acid-binding protein
MAFVLDASVAASWLFPDEDFPEAREAWRRSETENAIVPRHWWFEIRNTILTGERRGRMNEEVVTASLARLSVLPVIAAPLPDEKAVFILARRHRLTFYDAAYLELAQREGIALATLDRELAAAARAESIALVAQ